MRKTSQHRRLPTPRYGAALRHIGGLVPGEHRPRRVEIVNLRQPVLQVGEDRAGRLPVHRAIDGCRLILRGYLWSFLAPVLDCLLLRMRGLLWIAVSYPLLVNQHAATVEDVVGGIDCDKAGVGHNGLSCRLRMNASLVIVPNGLSAGAGLRSTSRGSPLVWVARSMSRILCPSFVGSLTFHPSRDCRGSASFIAPSLTRLARTAPVKTFVMEPIRMIVLPSGALSLGPILPKSSNGHLAIPHGANHQRGHLNCKNKPHR